MFEGLRQSQISADSLIKSKFFSALELSGLRLSILNVGALTATSFAE